MFSTTLTVRLADTDAAGILYFANQFQFIHETFEALIESEGFSFADVMAREDFMFVIVHAESDYLKPLKVGDALHVSCWVSRIGDTSFTVSYMLRRSGEVVGTAKTVHVTIDKKTSEKITVPEKLGHFLEKYAKT